MYRFSTGLFPLPERHGALITIDFIQKQVRLSSHLIKLKVWRQPQTAVLTSIVGSSFFQTRHGIMFAFDAANESSFVGVRQWMETERRVLKHTEPLVPRLLLACQVDRADRVVDSSRGAALATEFGGVKYLETSSATGEGVNEAFQWIAEEADRRWVATSSGHAQVQL